jgi:hypothetical protein
MIERICEDGVDGAAAKRISALSFVSPGGIGDLSNLGWRMLAVKRQIPAPSNQVESLWICDNAVPALLILPVHISWGCGARKSPSCAAAENEARRLLCLGGDENTRLRDEQLRDLPEMVRKAESPVLLLGDLNATPWFSAFRRLLRES